VRRERRPQNGCPSRDLRAQRPVRTQLNDGLNAAALVGDLATENDAQRLATSGAPVKQILTGIHWAEEPVSRITHIVSNVQLLEATPSLAEPSEVATKCRFLIYRNRVETETDILVGKREDLLRRVGSGWQIARRKIILDQNVLMTKNLTFFF